MAEPLLTLSSHEECALTNPSTQYCELIPLKDKDHWLLCSSSSPCSFPQLPYVFLKLCLKV